MRYPVSFQRILLAFVMFIGVLILIRSMYSQNLNFLFLAWNLFLAWIPYAISTLFKRIVHEQKWKQAVIFFSWFIFFPNALYLVTDLIHLDMESNIPKWFDAVLLFSTSVLGLLMAFISLFRVERYLVLLFERKLAGKIVLLILFFGSFGVYLGRFLRWNSWDLIRNPVGLVTDMIDRFLFPLAYLHTWGITLILSILFYLIYQSIKKLPSYLSREAMGYHVKDFIEATKNQVRVQDIK